MSRKQKHTGFAIAIAWPETYCKQSGAWYDGFINRLGISKHHYYKVGHAALVLVDDKTGRCHYFDFGRYHTPFQHGRVRSELTDDGLKMKVQAKISADKNHILNFEEILTELQNNAECHGEGAIHASYGRINFEKALTKAEEMQRQSPIKYGPFRYGGSNCSRFVNSVIRSGKPDLSAAFKLNFMVPLTPTPMNNVNAFGNKTVLPKMLPFTFTLAPIANKNILKGTLKEPVRAAEIPANAQWLAGEGAGSWFSITLAGGGEIEITRFSPVGKVECNGIFTVSGNQTFNIEKPYRIDYLSHCRKVKIIQNNVPIEFERTNQIIEVDFFQGKDEVASIIIQQKNSIPVLQSV
jgi:hypothetical protein